MPPSAYPTVAESGPRPLKFRRLPKNYEAITVVNVFEDRGASIVETADDVEQRWEFVYDGMEEAESKVLVDHWESARLSQGFDFTEPRDYPWTDTATAGTAFEDASVYYESFEADHSKVWVQSARIVLVRRPVN